MNKNHSSDDGSIPLINRFILASLSSSSCPLLLLLALQVWSLLYGGECAATVSAMDYFSNQISDAKESSIYLLIKQAASSVVDLCKSLT